MRACARKVEWLSMKNRVPAGRGEFRPVEVLLVTAEARSPFRKIEEEVTLDELNMMDRNVTGKLLGRPLKILLLSTISLLLKNRYVLLS